MELYRKHRPRQFNDIVGQSQAVKTLSKMLKRGFPHSLLLVGPSGCGKTTIARILRKKLKCNPTNFYENNSADFKGIEHVRAIRERVPLAAQGGGNKIWLLDECHMLTKDAQTALLKMLEEAPRHVYYILATTDSSKLIDTIKKRVSKIKLESVSESLLYKLVSRVCKAEKVELSGEVITKIAEHAEGSPRLALVLLQQVIGLEDEDEQLEAVSSTVTNRDAIEICRVLMRPRVRWQEVCKVLKEIDLEDAEGLRRLVLSYATTTLLSGSKISGRAYYIIQAFRDHLYDAGKAGFVANCREVAEQK